MSTVTHLDVNDYLDLYLYAGNMGDTLWQHEIIEKLQNFSHERSSKNQSLDIDALYRKYKHINEAILTLYQQLRNDATNDDLQKRIWNLKEQRLSLGHQLGLAKGKSFKN